MEESSMKAVHLVRPALGVVLLISATLATTAQAHAANPVHGRWVAQAPGGGTSYYHFHAATERTGTFDKGRFVHAYTDPSGRQVVLHGTYRLHHIGPRGKLNLFFDNGLHLKDVEHSGKNWLMLRHVGSGLVMTYSRVG
jgi:hypothetical protein